MRASLRILAVALALVLAAVLVSRVPADVFASTHAFLLVFAGAFVLLAGASILLVPARRLQAAIFLTPAREEPGVFGVARPEEMAQAVRPVMVALAALAVDMLALLLRHA